MLFQTYGLGARFYRKRLGVLGCRDRRDLDSSDQLICLPSDQIDDPDHNLTDLPQEVDYMDWITHNSLLKAKKGKLTA